MKLNILIIIIIIFLLFFNLSWYLGLLVSEKYELQREGIDVVIDYDKIADLKHKIIMQKNIIVGLTIIHVATLIYLIRKINKAV